LPTSVVPASLREHLLVALAGLIVLFLGGLWLFNLLTKTPCPACVTEWPPEWMRDAVGIITAGSVVLAGLLLVAASLLTIRAPRVDRPST
jgi:hypothetical protein